MNLSPPLFHLTTVVPSPVIITSIELLESRGRHFVRSTSEDGAVGIAATPEQMRYLYPMIEQQVIPYFLGKDARDLEDLMTGVYLYSANYKLSGAAFGSCVAWVEYSLLDLLGKLSGKPVHELLGPTLRREIPVYLSSLRRDTTPEEEVAWLAARVAETGVRAVKLKIGGRMSRNADAHSGRTEGLLKLAREHFGSDMTIYVDANGSYDAATAIWVGQSLSGYGVLWGWKWVTAYEGGAPRAVAERNPYYWKVDSQGDQLPYIDRVVYDRFEDEEVLLLRALSGEIDMHSRHIFSPTNRAVLFDSMERGDYRFFDIVHSNMNTLNIHLNLTHQDSVKRKIFQNKDFRIGLSYAIDRQELINLVYVGQGEAWQAAPRRESPFYNERLAKQYTEYNVDLANEHLDRAGYRERDAQGFRLGPDDQRISLIVEVSTSDQEHIDVLGLIQGYWQDVGIEMQTRVLDRSLATERRAAGETDAFTWAGDAGLQDAIVNPASYMVTPRDHWLSFAHAWKNWYLDLPGAEEPPAAPRRQLELYDQLKPTADAEEQLEHMKQILEIAAEEFYIIGINLGGGNYSIAKNNFRNVPASMPGSGGAYQNPAPTNPEQYFIDVGTR